MNQWVYGPEVGRDTELSLLKNLGKLKEKDKRMAGKDARKETEAEH